jgi:hypothetical protein
MPFAGLLGKQHVLCNSCARIVAKPVYAARETPPKWRFPIAAFSGGWCAASRVKKT